MEGLLSKARDRSLRIAIVGFGYVGECIGAVLAEVGYDVTGIDVSERTVRRFNAKDPVVPEPGLREIVERHTPRRIRATTDFAPIAEADFIVVTVGTAMDDRLRPDTRPVAEAARGVARYLRPGQAVALKGTTTPLTTETVVRPVLEESGLRAGTDFALGSSPERLAEGVALDELRALPIIVGGIDAQSTRLLAALWHILLGVETIPVSSPRVAEMSKLADNAFIDLNVALGNEIALICDGIGADAVEVIRAANTLRKGQHHVNILAPSMGVGGTCLTKDPWFLHQLGVEAGYDVRTFAAGRRANDFMPLYTTALIERAVGPLDDKVVAVLGLAFKANTGDLRFTPVLSLLRELRARRATLRLSDPLALPDEARDVTDLPLLAPMHAVAGADVVVVAAPHRAFLALDLRAMRTAARGDAFVDGRNGFDEAAVRNAGFRYFGIGRGAGA
jgi:UDP-N-acetyl-D-mannosaminuronic acid dehydrogenase